MSHFGEGNASDEAVSGVADAEQTWAPILLGDEDRSCAEPNLRAQLPGEHQVAERGEKLAGPVAVVPIAEEDGLHDCVARSTRRPQRRQ